MRIKRLQLTGYSWAWRRGIVWPPRQRLSGPVSAMPVS